jgi:Fe-S-cluster containining protein
MRWVDAKELIDYVCALLQKTDFPMDRLASICARVFQTRALAEKDPGSGQAGIRIETGMESFTCKQCGQCCLSLDYQDQLNEEDVEKWRRLGRSDILEWVGVFKDKDGVKTYRIWMTPGGRELSDKCPFLVKDPSSKRWKCRIHAIKPGICRQYPVSRKHALMTGCPGFGQDRT